MAEPHLVSSSRINLPNPPRSNDFFRARPRFRILGNAKVNETVFGAKVDTAKKKVDVRQVAEETISEPKPKYINFWEPHSRMVEDPARSTPTDLSQCPTP